MSKEREAFEEAMLLMTDGSFNTTKNHLTGQYTFGVNQTLWAVWQAAKAQAVPEGQILVNKGDYVELVRTNRERQKVVARLTEEVKILRDRKRYYKNKCKALEFGDD